MTHRIGVIGAGNIGSYHAETLCDRVSGAEVSAVFDVATDRAAAIAEKVGATAYGSAEELVNDPDVDAVLIASPGELHAGQVLSCVSLGKPVLCEKPLAPTTAECLKVLEAEMSVGARLVQLGFMRRYDGGYQRLKATLDSGHIGEALMLHCVHRNPSVYDYFTSDMSLTDSVVHEVDASRWLLADEIVAVTVVAGRPSPKAAIKDPQLVLFETASGVLVDVESFVNAQYGYDVRCELVASEGTATLATPFQDTVRSAGRHAHSVPESWRQRFDAAYHAELQDWVSSLATGAFSGATAWDGYAATAVAEAGLRARAEGKRVDVGLIEKPAFYDRR